MTHVDVYAHLNRIIQREQARARMLGNMRRYPNRHDRKAAAGFRALLCPGSTSPAVRYGTAGWTQEHVPAAIVASHAEARWQRVLRRWEGKHGALGAEEGSS